MEKKAVGERIPHRVMTSGGKKTPNLLREKKNNNPEEFNSSSKFPSDRGAAFTRTRGFEEFPHQLGGWQRPARDRDLRPHHAAPLACPETPRSLAGMLASRCCPCSPPTAPNFGAGQVLALHPPAPLCTSQEQCGERRKHPSWPARQAKLSCTSGGGFSFPKWWGRASGGGCSPLPSSCPLSGQASGRILHGPAVQPPAQPLPRLCGLWLALGKAPRADLINGNQINRVLMKASPGRFPGAGSGDCKGNLEPAQPGPCGCPRPGQDTEEPPPASRCHLPA